MKCTKCGYENNNVAKFCKQCGNPLKSESKLKNNKIMIICITIIICLLLAVAAYALINNKDTTSNSGTKINTHLTIHPKDPLDGNMDAMLSGDQLQIQIKNTKNWKPVSGAKIYITIQNVNTGENQTLEATTGAEGVAYIAVEAESGEYKIHGVFKGNENYDGDITNPDLIIVAHEEEVSQSSEPLRDGIDYDSSSLTPEQYEEVMNNPGGHYDQAGNYYAPGEGQ